MNQPRISQKIVMMPEPARRPLGRTLALLFSSLLLVVVAVYSWAAYAGMRQVVMGSVEQRLAGGVGQFVTLLQASAKSMVDSARIAADNPAIAAYLKARTRTHEAAAIAAIRNTAPKRALGLTSIVLLDPAGERLLGVAINPPGTEGRIDPSELAAAAKAGSGMVGRFHAAADSIYYPATVPVREQDAILGYLVQWRRLTSNPQQRDVIVRLIGDRAGLYLGSDSGDVWNDMVKPVPKPAVDIRLGNGLLAYQRPGVGKVLGHARAVAGTSWLVLLEFPAALVDSPVQGFVRRLGVIALVVLLIGLLVTLAVSRTITGPLGELTEAAEAVAAGDYTAHLTVRHQDEVARLSRSFNTMTDRVRESQATLEERVADRTRELQERNDDLEAFGYSISHDLRAPLRAMQGFSQIILEDYGDKLDDKGRQHAGRIVAAAKRMDELIRDLLAYSRLSRANLETAPISLQNVVNEALSQLEAELHKTGAQVRVTEPLPAVRGHQSTLSQVVANLIGNGMKFVAPGRAPEVKVRAEPRNGQVRLWVEDNGIGIRPEHQQRIFNVFERLHGNEQYPGTGIGLAIVKKGMERMGGKVGVESVVESGSSFWIELPRVDAS